jgi:U4/U6.U5 tri-snRNP-associated protein 2
LPDNYEIIDPSLADIQYVLNPTFTKENLLELDKFSPTHLDLSGNEFIPGLFCLEYSANFA